jgi:hypothetical protein
MPPRLAEVGLVSGLDLLRQRLDGGVRNRERVRAAGEMFILIDVSL